MLKAVTIWWSHFQSASNKPLKLYLITTYIGSHLTREPTVSPVLTKWWMWELMLATNSGSPLQMVTKDGSQILATKFGFVSEWLTHWGPVTPYSKDTFMFPKVNSAWPGLTPCHGCITYLYRCLASCVSFRNSSTRSFVSFLTIWSPGVSVSPFSLRLRLWWPKIRDYTFGIMQVKQWSFHLHSNTCYNLLTKWTVIFKARLTCSDLVMSESYGDADLGQHWLRQ